MKLRSVINGMILLLAIASPAFSQTNYRWDGSQNNNWDNSPNWSGGPGWPDASSHNAIFDIDDYNNRNDVDLRGGTFSVRDINLNDALDTVEFVSNNNGQGRIWLWNDLRYNTSAADGSGVEHRFDVELHVLNEATFFDGTAHRVTLNGGLFGTDDITISGGTGTEALRLTTANTYTGLITVNGGYVMITDPDALVNGGVAINNDHAFRMADNIDVNIRVIDGPGDLTITGGTLTMTVGGVGDFHLTGDVNGTPAGNPTARLLKRGLGKLSLSGLVTSMQQLNNGGNGQLILEDNSVFVNEIVAGTGEFIIRNGANVSLQGTGLARSGSDGLLLITGAGTTLASGSELACPNGTGTGFVEIEDSASVQQMDIVTVGKLGTGEMTVTSGATLSADGLGIGGKDSLENGGTGTLTVDGGASVMIDGETQLWTDTSTLIVHDEATFHTDELRSNVGINSLIRISDPTSGGSALVLGDPGSATGTSFHGTIEDMDGASGSIEVLGQGSIVLSRANTFSGGLTINGGLLRVTNETGSATGTGDTLLGSGSTLDGTGIVGGNTVVETGSTVSPGFGTFQPLSTGELTVTDISFADGSSLVMDIFNLDSTFDHFVVAGTASLAGSLDVRYASGIVSAPGDSYVLVSAGTLVGSFDSVSFPDGQNWEIEYDYSAGTITVGLCPDADLDGVCDVDDICDGFDDAIDGDGDGVPDGCDLCPIGDDSQNADGDYHPDACDACPMSPDVHNLTQNVYYPTIHEAVAAVADGDVIELGECIFFWDNIQFPNGVDFELRGQSTELTIIDGGNGSNTDPIFFMDSTGQTQNTVISDLTLQNGWNTNGGGARCVNTSPVFRRVDFRNNRGTSLTTGTAHIQVGTNAEPVFDRCRFIDGENAAQGIYGAPSARVTMNQCLFVNDETARIARIDGPVNEFTNCTISAEETQDGLAFLVINGTANLANSVIIGDFVTQGAGASVETMHCLYPGAFGGGNIDGLPTFVDAMDGDYRLAEGSLGIDAADKDIYDSLVGDATDLNGDPRLHDDLGVANTGVGTSTYLDMGAYEFTGLTDSDGDGVGDALDLCPGFDDNLDADGDGTPDDCDICTGNDGSGDDDEDGTCNNLDACPNDPNKIEEGICGCGVADTDADSDGAPACIDCNDDDNMVFPGNEETTCDDVDNDCDPLTEDNPSGICDVQPPVAGAIGPRYLEVTPAPSVVPVALAVTSDDAGCLAGTYIDLDSDPELADEGIGILVGSPVYRTPEEWGTIQVRGLEIVPGYSYQVTTIVEAGAELSSEAFSTHAHGDIDNNGLANFADIQSVVFGFQGVWDGPLGAVDLAPCLPNAIVNFEDIQQAVLAFQTQSFSSICELPCSGGVASTASTQPSSVEPVAVGLQVQAVRDAGAEGVAVEVWARGAANLHAFQLALVAVDAGGASHRPVDAWIDEDRAAFTFAGQEIVAAMNQDRGEIGSVRLGAIDPMTSDDHTYLATFEFQIDSADGLTFAPSASGESFLLDADGRRIPVMWRDGGVVQRSVRAKRLAGQDRDLR